MVDPGTPVADAGREHEAADLFRTAGEPPGSSRARPAEIGRHTAAHGDRDRQGHGLNAPCTRFDAVR